jgi:hypothetical protein
VSSVDDVHHDQLRHGHEHPSSWRDAHAAPGPASLLDLGGDVGAVSVRLAGDTATGELTACPRGRPDRHFHTGVHLRTVGDRRAWVAVFPAVPAGRYSLLDDEGCEHTPFDVIGGAVTTMTLCG